MSFVLLLGSFGSLSRLLLKRAVSGSITLGISEHGGCMPQISLLANLCKAVAVCFSLMASTLSSPVAENILFASEVL